MKKLFYSLVITLFVNNYSYSQTLFGVVKDSINNKPIEAVNISKLNDNETVSTDLLGRYNVKVNNSKDKLLVSCIGYQSVIINLNDFVENKEYLVNLFLIPKSEILSEVVITRNNNKKGTLKKIGLKKPIVAGWFLQTGHEICTVVKNPFKREERLKTVILNLQKTVDIPVLINHFKINFYEYNKKNNKPGNRINSEDLIVFPENKTYELNVNLNDYDIFFPEDGVCIGVEAIKTLKNISKGDSSVLSSDKQIKETKITRQTPSPYLVFTDSKKEGNILTWERDVNNQADWTVSKITSMAQFSHTNLKINLEVKVETK
jgi:hypothetical protein